MSAKKKVGEFPTYGDNDIFMPIMYLLYAKDVISEDELIKYIERYNPCSSLRDVVSIVESIFV